ncbi:aminotransferase class V-fold PLP-dependent enzyme [Ideonella sp. YS5]|uniref:aminotransferase class V-fold PLP-dependent enzyme n=1 Tax=Ideonella sp. YS5 TaxID=3453714 RepID=UPI003EE89D52
MEIYLDANATTPVLPQAQAAALAAMASDFGNPSSIHSTGLKAKATIDSVRASARRVLGAPTGRLIFLSGATEGIQTAVLSALTALKQRRKQDPGTAPSLLLYGATEHKAVPEALRHWNALLGLDLTVLAIPVGPDGRHDLAWLREHAPRAGLVCTMAANNETGVISDLDGIAATLAGSPALWMVDSVQALGKLPLALLERGIDYAPFSGHKLYAPKGIGLLYVREGAPFMPLMAGGGQEGAARSGTENMAGIAAMGAVLAALEEGRCFRPSATLHGYRARLAAALEEAFPGLQFNAPAAHTLPTTLNFSVPGCSARLLLDLFDAAGVRVSGGSACGASKALPSFVLQAMGLPAWRTASAVRLSFGPAADEAFIDEACARIRACGQALRESCQGLAAGSAETADGVVRWLADGGCCHVVADRRSGRCVVIDPQPEIVERLVSWLRCQRLNVAAVLRTGAPRDDGIEAAAAILRSAFSVIATDGPIRLGERRLAPLRMKGDAIGFVLDNGLGPRLAFVRDAAGVPKDGLAALEPEDLVVCTHDPHNRLARRVGDEHGDAGEVGDEWAIDAPALHRLLDNEPSARLIDVREAYEQCLGAGLALGGQAVPLSCVLDALPGWLALPANTPLVFFCRSGNRSGQVARALRRLGHARSFSLAGGLALWPHAAQEVATLDERMPAWE